jgi:hypothetical protein
LTIDQFPFASARRTHADDADGLGSEQLEDHGDDAVIGCSDCAKPPGMPGANDRAVEVGFVKVGEVQAVIGDVCEPLRLVPNNSSHYNVATN